MGVLVTISLSLYTIGCADDPSSLGLNFIPPGETTGVRIFDSFIDTMNITSQNIKYYVNTSSSENLMVGKSGTYSSKALIKFSGLSGDYDSATVNSATLTLRYKNYYFPTSTSDSLGQISFDIYKVLQNLGYETATLDSVNSSSFGTVSQGNFTGSPTADSQEVFISLNTSMVKDWLEYAADTNYSVKNYGIALTPGNSSNVVKAFYSSVLGDENLRPRLQVIVTKNGDTDTLNTTSSQTVSFVDASITPSSETFAVQGGVSYIQVMKFDMSRLPSTATINDVQLFLSLDSANCIFSSQTTYSIIGQYISDSTSLLTSGAGFTGSSVGNGQYMMRLVGGVVVSPFQRWLLGEPNYGLMLRATNHLNNLDLFRFFNVSATDPNKRPHVIIRYTPRVNP